VHARGQVLPAERDLRAVRAVGEGFDLPGELEQRVGIRVLALELQEVARLALQPGVDQRTFEPVAQDDRGEGEQRRQAEAQQQEGDDDSAAQPAPVMRLGIRLAQTLPQLGSVSAIR
jgi:hypothetical protein